MSNGEILPLSYVEPQRMLRLIRSEYRASAAATALSSDSFLKENATFPSGLRCEIDDLFRNSTFDAAFRLPDLDSKTDWPTTGTTLDITPYIRSFLALSKLRRKFSNNYNNSTTIGTSTHLYEQLIDGSWRPTTTTTPISTYGINGCTASYSESANGSGQITSRDSYSFSVSHSLSGIDWLDSVEILGLISSVEGYESWSRGSISRKTPFLIYEPYGVSSLSPSISIAKTADDAKQYIDTLNIDTSATYRYGISITTRYVDLLFSYKHDI